MKSMNIHEASMRKVCSRSIWNMIFMNIYDKEYAARARQVCDKNNLHVKKMTVCGRFEADLLQE